MFESCYLDREAELLLEGERFEAARPVLADVGIDEATARITDWQRFEEDGVTIWTGVVHLAGDLDVISGEVRLESADGDISPRSASARLPDGLVEWSRPAALVP